jgi:putative redox protein
MSEIHVHHVHGDHFLVKVGGHTLSVDQPEESGGEDRGPTPTELFVAGLAACVGFYAGRYLRRHDVDSTGLAVESDFSMSDERPSRVTSVAIRVRVPVPLSAERWAALERVVERCTVHNTLRDPPAVRIEVEAGAVAA